MELDVIIVATHLKPVCVLAHSAANSMLVNAVCLMLQQVDDDCHSQINS